MMNSSVSLRSSAKLTSKFKVSNYSAMPVCRQFNAEGATGASAPKGLAKYGGRHIATLIPGDGIGKELCSSVKSVFKALNVPVDFEEVELSGYTQDPAQIQGALESLKRNKIGLKGVYAYCHLSL